MNEIIIIITSTVVTIPIFYKLLKTKKSWEIEQHNNKIINNRIQTFANQIKEQLKKEGKWNPAPTKTIER
jgi:hypothetical protein